MKKTFFAMMTLFSITSGATSPHELEGIFTLKSGENCPTNIETISFGLDDLTVFDRDTGENGKDFIRFGNIDLGMQSQTYGQFSEKSCFKTVLIDNKITAYSKTGLSVFRPCFSVKLEEDKSIELVANTLNIKTHRHSCTYIKQ